MSRIAATDIEDMVQPDPAQTSLTEPPTGSRWKRLNLLDLRFAGLVVAVIGLIVWLTYYHSHTYVVEAVLDGDTLIVSKWGWQFTVQLAGADAPEIHKNEPFSEGARFYLKEQLLGRKIWLDFLDTGRKLDYKDRMLCWAWIDGENISYTLVVQGLARFSGAAERDHRTILALLENDARENRRGLWSARTAAYQPPPEDD
jgi:endonuclease YncB( thermonuclease family)